MLPNWNCIHRRVSTFHPKCLKGILSLGQFQRALPCHHHQYILLLLSYWFLYLHIGLKLTNLTILLVDNIVECRRLECMIIWSSSNKLTPRLCSSLSLSLSHTHTHTKHIIISFTYKNTIMLLQLICCPHYIGSGTC